VFRGVKRSCDANACCQYLPYLIMVQWKLCWVSFPRPKVALLFQSSPYPGNYICGTCIHTKSIGQVLNCIPLWLVAVAPRTKFTSSGKLSQHGTRWRNPDSYKTRMGKRKVNWKIYSLDSSLKDTYPFMVIDPYPSIEGIIRTT